jgi:hypothetical protein
MSTPEFFEQHFPWYIDSSDTDNLDCQCGAACDGLAGWSTHLAKEMDNAVTAIDNFIKTWSSSYLADDLAVKLRCEELDALVALLAASNKRAASVWLRAHSAGDECGDLHCGCDKCRGDEA